MKRVIVSRDFAGPVTIKAEDEQIACNRGARVILCEGTNLVVEVLAKIEKQKGADGGLYDAIIFDVSYPGVAAEEDERREVSDDQRQKGE